MSIKVNRSPIPDQLWSALRQTATLAGGWLIGKGYLEADTATAIGSILLVVVPIIYGQWNTRMRAKQLASIALSPKVPDSVAVIK